MNQKVSTGLGVAVIVIMAITAGVFVWKISQRNPIAEFNVSTTLRPKTDKAEKFCTMEAKLCSDGSYVSRSGPNCEFAACPVIVSLPDKLIILSPKGNNPLSSPVTISGRARGTWFFEGVFPVEIYDSADKLLGSGQARFVPKNTDDTWMTDNFVDFQGEINFSDSTTSYGYLLFKKDNPSGKPEMNESFKLPVKLSQGGAQPV